MAALSVCCVWCAEHAFKVDEITLGRRILVMKCPNCGKLTGAGLDGRTREFLILPVGPDSEERKPDE